MEEPIIGPELGRKIADLQVAAGEIAIWWLGQSSTALKGSDGKILMVDPYFPTDRPPDQFIFPHPPLRGPDLAADFVFCTHDHRDHTDPEYLLSLLTHHQKTRLFLTQEGAERLRAAGAPDDRIQVVKENDSVVIGRVQVTALASKTAEASNTTHLGYVFKFDAGKLWHSGDMMRGITSIPELMDPVIAQRPDVALLTTTPDQGGEMEFPPFSEAANLARRIGARVAIPWHYRCFVKRDFDPQGFVAQFRPGEATKPVVIEFCGYYIYRR